MYIYIYVCMCVYIYIYISFMNFRFDWCAHVILSCMLCASCSLVRLVGVERARIGGKCLAHVLADRHNSLRAMVYDP